MQNITDSEFQREVEALKSHRRISVNRPLLDPDLPDLAAAYGGGREILGPDASRAGVSLSDDGPSSSAGGRTPSTRSNERQAFTARRRGTGASSIDTSSSNSQREAARSPITSDDDVPLTAPMDPSHLFWVPASMHPEISPTDFRKFLHEHASRAVREGATPSESPSSPSSSSSSSSGLSSGSTGTPQASYPFASRASSIGGGLGGPSSPGSPIDLVSRNTSIARRGSTLRRQYRPESDTDDGSDGRRTPEDVGGLQRGGLRGSLARRAGSTRQAGPALSIEDLQKLELLAEEASKSEDPAQLRSVLRRTMSLSMPGAALDQVDAVPADGEDAPLIVPRPGQILRRAARTKIRKSSISESRQARRRGPGSGGAANGDSGSESGSAGGRMDMASVALEAMRRRESDQSGSGLSSGEEDVAGGSSRPVSDEATASIVDAYSRHSYISDGSQRTSLTSLTDSVADSADGLGDTTLSADKRAQNRSVGSSDSPPLTPTQSSQSAGYFDISREASTATSDRLGPASHALSSGQRIINDSPLQSPDNELGSNDAVKRPIPISHVPPVPGFEKARPIQPPLHAATAPPGTGGLHHLPQAKEQVHNPSQHQAELRNQPPLVMPSQQHSVPPASSRGHAAGPSQFPVPTKSAESTAQRHGKEKKGGFASWFGIGKEEDEAEKQAKARRKAQEKERKEREAQEAERQEREREASKEKDTSSFLGALFGSKKRGGDDHHQHQPAHFRNEGQITAGSLLDRNRPGAPVHYYRYPIHIERAVYRLSHIKLANSRRPLYEQVLISNLMFWYLSSPTGTDGQSPAATSVPQQPIQNSDGTGAAPHHGHASRKPTLVDSNVPESGTPTPTAEVPNPASPAPKAKRTGLVKPNRAPPGSRSAEMAIPAAGYGAQHRQIDSDMAKQQGTNRTGSAQANGGSAQTGPGPSSGQLAPGPPAMAPSISVGQVVDPRSLGAHSGYHVPPPAQGTPGSGRLPPGAAPPGSTSGRGTSTVHQVSASMASGSSTSPTLNPERVRGKQSPSSGSFAPDARSGSSGAWLASGGEPRRRGPSPVGDEQAWLGGGGPGASDPSSLSSRPRSKSPQPDRTSDPVLQSWRSQEHDWEDSKSSRQRASEPRDVGSDYNGTAHRHDARSLDAGDGRVRKISSGADGRSLPGSRQPSSRPATSGSDNSSYTSAQSGRSSPNQPIVSLEGADPRSRTNGGPRGMAPINPASAHSQSSGPAVVLPGGSAMLEAARTSQSRRR
ncbi:Activator of mitotic machinery Cdc14 phosphatase activation C-terminal [Ceraceosorus bombacis]|uniref:Activator of mitotic machinery Cdc14 phosphatase activation C-terminal n=1 Tax=Ceraceosorus bombacis TaxID=401625 RepID=A0A0N7L8S5_9BASI|nr:Activator of mitotic machinery Cdc14 phosphatase activation C-terminal [Ceraceosorus bombacis]